MMRGNLLLRLSLLVAFLAGWLFAYLLGLFINLSPLEVIGIAAFVGAGLFIVLIVVFSKMNS